MDVRAILDAELLDKLEDLDELDLALDTELRLDEDLLDCAVLEIELRAAELRMELTLELDVVTLDLALDATLRLDEVPLLDLAARLAAELAWPVKFGAELVVLLVVLAGRFAVIAAATVRTFKAGDASDALPARSNALML